MDPTDFRQALFTALGGSGSWSVVAMSDTSLVLWIPVGLCTILVAGRTLLAYFLLLLGIGQL